jgi:glutathione S-transferase
VDRLFHIARAGDWEAARLDGTYRVSTLGKLLDDEGFIHLSFAHQVKRVADAFYRGMHDVVLLELDPERLAGRVIVEAVGDSEEWFPHLYGPINRDDVDAVRPYRPGADGRFEPVA